MVTMMMIYFYSNGENCYSDSSYFYCCDYYCFLLSVAFWCAWQDGVDSRKPRNLNPSTIPNAVIPEPHIQSLSSETLNLLDFLTEDRKTPELLPETPKTVAGERAPWNDDLMRQVVPIHRNSRVSAV